MSGDRKKLVGEQNKGPTTVYTKPCGKIVFTPVPDNKSTDVAVSKDTSPGLNGFHRDTQANAHAYVQTRTVHVII